MPVAIHPLLDWPISATFAGHEARVPSSISPGVDLACPENTPLPSPCTGRVMRWQWSDSGGRMLIISDANMRTWYLLHLNAALVAIGEQVTAGQPVALSGNTGKHTTGPHVHISCRSHGEWIDPVPVLKGE